MCKDYSIGLLLAVNKIKYSKCRYAIDRTLFHLLTLMFLNNKHWLDLPQWRNTILLEYLIHFTSLEQYFFLCFRQHTSLDFLFDKQWERSRILIQSSYLMKGVLVIKVHQSSALQVRKHGSPMQVQPRCDHPGNLHSGYHAFTHINPRVSFCQTKMSKTPFIK